MEKEEKKARIIQIEKRENFIKAILELDGDKYEGLLLKTISSNENKGN